MPLWENKACGVCGYQGIRERSHLWFYPQGNSAGPDSNCGLPTARWRPKHWFITSLKPSKHELQSDRHDQPRPDIFINPLSVIWRELRSNGWRVRHKRRLKGSLFMLSRQTWHCQLLLTAPVYPPITCFEHEVMSVCARRGWKKKNLQRRRYSPKHDADPSN